jgi:DNA-binding response OmpR family regulator
LGYSFAVVDDDDLLRDLIRRALMAAFAGCDITEFEDGASALEQISIRPFDLVIVDSRLPRMDGEQVVSSLRSRKISLPIIMLSNAPEYEDTGRAAGIDHFLYKADLHELPALVRRCFAERE